MISDEGHIVGGQVISDEGPIVVARWSVMKALLWWPGDQ